VAETSAPDVPRLLSLLAHDLRTPLATVGGFARTLARLTELDERQARFVALIVEAADDMDRQIELVSLLGRVGTGRLGTTREIVVLAAVARDVAGRVPDRADGRGVQVVIEDEAATAELDRDAAVAAVGLLATAPLRLDLELPGVTVTVRSDGLRLGPLSEPVAAVLLDGGRDAAVGTALVVLGAAGGRVEPDGDAVAIRFG
jgi:signal transduction histidine kinase